MTAQHSGSEGIEALKAIGVMMKVKEMESIKTPTPTGTEARVVADIARRQALGLAKYGTSVEANPLPLRAWLQHQYEELLDAAVYCRRAIDEMAATGDDFK